jgi:DNA-binding MarR family transcriptional regulator
MSVHQLALALRAAYLAMHRRTDAALADEGITADQFLVLDALQQAAFASQRELVARTDSDPNTLRAMLVLLEERGLVERRPHPTDRRARSVSITPAGRAVYRRAWDATELLWQEIQAALPPQAASRVADDLVQFAQHLQHGRSRQRRQASSKSAAARGAPSRQSASTSRSFRP